MILVTGAAGKTGRAVIRALARRRQPIRAFIRREEQDSLVKQLGAQETTVGDLQDPSALAQAVQGVTSLYHICPNMHPSEIEIGRAILTAAQEAGVRRFVYHSVLHPQVEAMPHHWHKLRVEEAIFESGLDYTILQPAAYMQNLQASWESILGDGVYRVPYAPDTRLGMVDLMDVAEVAARVLTETGHVGAIYELAGPDILTQEEAAAVLSQELRRDVRVEQIPRDRWRQQAQAGGLSDFAVNTLLAMFEYYERFGFWGNANVLSWLLKRPPTSFAQFVRRSAQQAGD